MTLRETPPFRADHVGSLLRPARLLEARDRRATGEIDADELRATEDEAIRDVVRMQRDVGLRSATDGEFRRTSWHMDFIYRLGGIHPTDEKIQVHFRNAEGNIDFESAALAVDAPIRLTETIFGDDFAYLQSIVDQVLSNETSIIGLTAHRHKYTLELLDPAMSLATHVHMRFKHAFACQRPV